MRWTFLVGSLAALAACPGGNGGGKINGGGPVPPLTSGVGDMRVELPAIPAKIETTKSAPLDGNAPSARSPILDILKAENDRELGALRKQKEPAYYLAYQLVEQRVVNLE